MKVVYLVLEPQYQNALTEAAKFLNDQNSDLGINLNGYLIEELRDSTNFSDFKKDISEADVFIGSLTLGNKILILEFQPHLLAPYLNKLSLELRQIFLFQQALSG